jgi:hypothetical protein
MSVELESGDPLEKRVGELERLFAQFREENDRRHDELEGRWKELQNTLTNVRATVYDLAERSQLTKQLGERTDARTVEIQREVRELSTKLDELGGLDGKLEQVLAMLAVPGPVLALAARGRRKREG